MKENLERLVNRISETLNSSKQHVSFIASHCPQFASNLQSIEETLQEVQNSLETVKLIHGSICECYEGEKACKNQAYDFILTEKLFERYKLFASLYPTETYKGVTGSDILAKHVK